MWNVESLIAFAMAIAAFVPGAVQILPPEAAMRRLGEARSLKCAFSQYASADWNADEPAIKAARQDDFTFHIDGIDHVKRAARLIGNAGAEDLVATRGDATVSFVERVPVGTLNVTTVYAWTNRAGYFKAVHSRHTAIDGPSPSQNYGWCQPWQ